MGSFELLGITVACMKKLVRAAPAEKVGFIEGRVLENALKLDARSSRPMLVKACTVLVEYMSVRGRYLETGVPTVARLQ